MNAVDNNSADAGLSPNELEDALNRHAGDLIPRFAFGLGILFSLLAASHLLFRWSPYSLALAGVSVSVALGLFITRNLSRRDTPVAGPQSLALGSFLLGILGTSIHQWLNSDPTLSAGFVLLIVAAGGIFLSWSKVWIVFGCTWVGWLTPMLYWTSSTHSVANLVKTGAALVAGTTLSAFFHRVRLTDTLRFELGIAEMTRAADQISSAKRAAESANQAKSDFLTRVSHELRTPLNGVLGMADLLLDSKLDADQRADTQTLRESAEHLLSIIEDLLDLSRIESRKIVLTPSDCDLHQTLQSAVESVRPAAAKKNLELQIDLHPTLPRWVNIDSQKLRQVLYNLLSNAVKFTDQGSVRVVADCTPFPGRGWRLRISVIDTGQGIESTALGRLFQPFELGDLSASRRHSGAGLGLTIARQLAGLLGGRIEVRSMLHKGSEFIVEIPAGTPHTQEPPPPRPRDLAESLGPINTFRALRVLLVDDNPTNRTLAVKFLTRLGHETVMARNGEEAIQWTNRETFDVILMDCVMPGMDGITATKELKHSLKQRCPKIVALTAEASEADRRKCLEAGMDDYLSKPFTREALEACLSKLPLPDKS